MMAEPGTRSFDLGVAARSGLFVGQEVVERHVMAVLPRGVLREPKTTWGMGRYGDVERWGREHGRGLAPSPVSAEIRRVM